ncbi:12471_t:CDS:2, partial [Gigaspora rosea]
GATRNKEIKNVSTKSIEKSTKIKTVSTELIDHLRCLKLFVHEAAYSKRIEFISFISDSPNKVEILFKNVVNTEERINRHVRILSKCFHEDRTKNQNSPFVLQEIYKSQGDELYKLILGFKEHLLNKLKITLKIEDYEKHGNELWKITIDYHNASKGQWNKLKILKKDDIEELSSELLKQNSMLMGELAYNQYREACKIADKAKMLKRQVKLRGYMALCLYFTKKFLEAPLYALAALRLQIKDSTITQQELNETKKIFDKVNGGSEENGKEKSEKDMPSDFDLNTDIKIENDFNNAMALIRTNNQGISLFDRTNIINAIDENLFVELFIKAERSLVSYQTSYKEILRTKMHAKLYQAKGCVIMAYGGTLGVTALAAAGAEIYSAIMVTGIASLSGPIGLIAGFGCLAGGYYFGYLSFKEGKEMFKEPKIREKLNEIINKALSAYDDEKYQEFINALSEEYDNENHKRLLNCCDKIGITGIENIVDTLQIHGFRSDGIAYLLIVLGEVLGSGKIEIKGVTPAVLKVNAKTSFHLALNDKLVNEAKELDKCTSKLRKTCQGSYERYIKSTYGKLKDAIFSAERTRLALEYLDDSLEMPFFSRLEEMRNIARTNIAILNVLEHDKKAYKEAKETIEEVRKSVEENFQFVSKAELRLEVLEDFLWIIGGEYLSDNNTSFNTLSVATKSTSKLDDKSINYLNNQQSFNQNKYYYKAVYFEHLAVKETKINKLKSLRHWQSAQENYNIAHEIDPDNPIYSLGYARCLLKLSKFTQVIKLSDTYPGLNSLSEYWHLRS